MIGSDDLWGRLTVVYIRNSQICHGLVQLLIHDFAKGGRSGDVSGPLSL